MCAIIDTCVFPKMFRGDGSPERRFKPIYDWIHKKGGKLITGGTTYERELGGALGVFAEYEKMQKLIKLDKSKVDRKERELKAREPAGGFDDAHLVAMVILSKCCVICTDEKKAVKYFKRREFYPKGVKPPSVYRNEKHKHLCCADNEVLICKK